VQPRLVHLVRHAEVENPKGVIYGLLPGFGLSARGRQQAAAAARHLVAICQPPLAIVASPLDRAQETATFLRDHVGAPPDGHPPIDVDPRLTEASAGMDGLPRGARPWRHLRRLFDPEARARMEAPTAVLTRMRHAVRDALARVPGDLAVVSHQFPIRMARVAFERRVGHPKAPRLPARVPWLFIRGPCNLASITTLRFAEDELLGVDYWEPPAASAT